MAQLSPYPIFRAFDSNGAPLAGGKLYSFIAGTSTPKATYTDQGAGTPNANPTILDANGEAHVWLDGNYKLRLDDAGDVTQDGWPIDNISQFNTTVNATLSPAVDADAFQLNISGTINEAATGTHTLVGGLRVEAPLINAAGAAVTETASLYIDAAPSAVGATNYALHVDAGATQLDGTLDVDGNTTLAGNLTTNGTLDVAGQTTLDGGVDVSGASSFDDALTVANTLTVQDTLNITTGAPVLEITDTDAGTDAAATAAVHLGRTADTDLGVMGFTAADAHLELANNISGGNLELTTTSGTVALTGAATVSSTLDVTGLTTLTGGLVAAADATIAHTGIPKLILRDTGTPTDTAVQGMIEIQDNTSVIMAQIGMASASDGNLEINNGVSGGNLELTTSGGTVAMTGAATVSSTLTVSGDMALTEASPVFSLTDTDAASDNATTASILFGRTADTDLGQIGFLSGSDSNFELTNNVANANIELTPTGLGGVVMGSTVFALLILQDTGNAGADSRAFIQAQDSAGSVQWQIATGSGSDGNLIIDNQLSGADLEFSTDSGDFVFLSLPTSDPTKAGALWNNSGVVNVSAG